MKLSQLYTNNENFKNTKFNLDGLNVIYADVKTKLDDKNNSHNLGKTLIIEVFDFLLLKQVANKEKHFLFSTEREKGLKFFEDYIFYLEILLNNQKFLTIRRSVKTNTKISFSLNTERVLNFSPPTNWDYEHESLDNAKEIFSSYLNFKFFKDKDYDYRKSINYAMRGQRDYLDIYRLTKFVGQDISWKPFMFDFLGFPGKLLKEKYFLDKEIEEKQEYIRKLVSEFSISSNQRDEIIALKNIKQEEIDEFVDKLDKFNFYEKDKRIIKTGVNEIEQEISTLNSQAYKIEYELKNIETALKNKFSFNLKKVTKIFSESELAFPEQLEKSYEDLIKFNKKISNERNKILVFTQTNKKEELNKIRKKLKDLNQKKEELLSFIQDTETFNKFKQYQKSQIVLEADLYNLNAQLEIINKIKLQQEELDQLKSRLEIKVKEIREEHGKTETNLRYNEFRTLFSKYYEYILGEKSILTIGINKNNNIEFNPPKVLNDETKIETAQGKGYTYSKLFCVCFDLAILTLYNKESYYRFVYHDDVLASEDDGVKFRLLKLIELICQENDIQYLLSTIKSDLPVNENGEIQYFSDIEIVLKLNDLNENGTLFGYRF